MGRLGDVVSDPAPISVVIPAYNAEVFIAETLASVASQSLTPVEVIVVDDGSSDGTRGIAEAFGAKVIRQPNQGPSAARNTGAAAAVGQWIAFVDADDVWEAKKLEAQYASLQLAPAAKFSFCDYSQFNGRGRYDASVLNGLHRFFTRVERRPLGNDVYEYGGVGFVASLHDQFYIMPSTVLVEREAMLACGGGFSRNFRTVEDHEFFLRFARDHLGTYVDRPLVRYRRHSNSATADTAKMNENRLALAEQVARQPDDYCPETVGFFTEHRTKFIRNAAVAQIYFGDIHRGRKLLHLAQSRNFEWLSAVLLVLVALNRFLPVQRGLRLLPEGKEVLRTVRSAIRRRARKLKFG